ncbi:PRA1 family protein F2 [Quercus robur]|uniref:PRA1 family protein F2 n=1 Tax=Quercus robur TaxID=38942 RepID=UPI00216398A0|nr:PRA1 family protein F2 [Quercus robur]
MTTYGTIPAATPSSSSNLQFVSLANERINSGLGMPRPWKEMIKLQDLSFPTSVSQLIQRIKINVAVFRMNYAIIILFILFLSLLWHPVSMIVFIVMMVAWLFLYFLRDEPLVVMGYDIDDRMVMLALLPITVLSLFLTNAKKNIIVALAIGLVVVLVHGALKETDDLVIVDGDEGIVSGGNGDMKMPLKNPASSSFSLS